MERWPFSSVRSAPHRTIAFANLSLKFVHRKWFAHRKLSCKLWLSGFKTPLLLVLGCLWKFVLTWRWKFTVKVNNILFHMEQLNSGMAEMSRCWVASTRLKSSLGDCLYILRSQMLKFPKWPEVLFLLCQGVCVLNWWNFFAETKHRLLVGEQFDWFVCWWGLEFMRIVSQYCFFSAHRLW